MMSTNSCNHHHFHPDLYPSSPPPDRSQFHVRLEGHVAPWRGLEHEAEVDVDDVAVLVHHDVTVVPVLDLQKTV